MNQFMHIGSKIPFPRGWLRNPACVTLGLLGEQGGRCEISVSRSTDRDPSSAAYFVSSIGYYNPTPSDLLQTQVAAYTLNPTNLRKAICRPHCSLLVTPTDTFRS